jgi:ankyrin repeat protein
LLVTAGAHLDLHAAAFLGKRGVVEAALVAGQTVDETDSIGMTALHRAIQGSAEAVVELLLQRGADVERSADTYTFGARALHLAAASGVSRQVIERLIEAGADVNHRANPGTPMQIAQRHGHMTTVRVLRDLGAR